MQKALTKEERLSEERTLLANERTMLAYVRTALAAFVFGIAIFRFFTEWKYAFSIGVLGIAVGFLFLIIGIAYYFIRVKRIKNGSGSLMLLFLSVFILGFLVVIAITQFGLTGYSIFNGLSESRGGLRETETAAQAFPIPPAVCGDGILNSEYEFCDDGNNQSGDGCTFDCFIESGELTCPLEHLDLGGGKCEFTIEPLNIGSFYVSSRTDWEILSKRTAGIKSLSRDGSYLFMVRHDPERISYIFRTAIMFDASSFENLNIESAELVLPYNQIENTHPESNDYLSLVEFYPSDLNIMSGKDFGKFGNDELAKRIDVSKGDELFILNDKGLSKLNDKGIALFGIRGGYDLLSEAPNNGEFTELKISIYEKPKLKIVYSLI